MDRALKDVDGRSLGVIGTETDVEGLFVGDLVGVYLHNLDRAMYGIVVECGLFHRFSVWGCIDTPLKDLTADKVLDHSVITEEILYDLHRFRAHKVKEMTLKEIEKELGYPFKLVD